MTISKAQPFLGILMLDTNFPRILGDAGNINSYKTPARTHVVKDAGSLDIVKDGLPSEHLIAAFCNAAKELQADGAFAIISTCGFLISIQDQIANAVDIPVMVSALSLYPHIQAKYKNRPIGILTASQNSLGAAALKAAKIDRLNVHIKGMEGCPAFADAILRPKEQQLMQLNSSEIESYAIRQALSLIDNNPDIAAFILECGNLPPYATAIQDATNRPVYSILNAVAYLETPI